MRRSERVTVKVVGALGVTVERDGVEERYFIGHFTRGHEFHRRLTPGDTLVAVSDTSSSGETFVEMPGCGCRTVLTAMPEVRDETPAPVGRDLMIVAPESMSIRGLVERFPDLTARYEVRLDRRWRERRTSDAPAKEERRRRERRQLDVSAQLHRDGWVVIPAAQRQS